MKGKQAAIAVLLFIVLSAGVYVLFKQLGHGPAVAGQQAPPPVVFVTQPAIRTVTHDLEFTGSTEAVAEVQIRARVKGFLTRINFQDGADVTQGTPLFEIEPDLYQAQQTQAQANVTSSQSALTQAQTDLERLQEAVKTHAVSQQQVTTALATRDKAQAALLAAQAAWQEANLNLAYTHISSPIDGRISMRYVDQGNLVGAGENTLLADVVQLDPLYVTFHVSENLFLNNLAHINVQDANAPPLFVGLQNETDFPHKGVLDYIGNRVDPSTGTVTVRGQLSNPDKTLLPGMFVRIHIPVGTQPDAVLVEEQALGTDIGGKYLLVVDANNVVERRPVQIGRQVENLRVITAGLSVGQSYIVRGLQFAFPGAKVNPQLATQSPAGVTSGQ